MMRLLLRQKKTKLERFGDENYMSFGSQEYRDAVKAIHGDENYRNIEKAKETNRNKSPEQKREEANKRLATYNRHKAEDPNFAIEIQRKSVETRKRNHGEDYTNRKKCAQTIREQYDVENPYQIPSVVEKVKQDNIDKYGVPSYSSTQECRDKVSKTCEDHYGASCYFASEEGKEKIQSINLERYGVKCTFQSESVIQKIKETNMAKYGVEHPMQNSEVRKKSQSRYSYNGIHFDSSPELALYIWLCDNKIPFEYQPKITFKYLISDEERIYCPDFKINDEYVEIKGDQFFNDKGQMQNPYDHTQDHIYEAKHQCMIDNKVRILRTNDYMKYLNYVADKYGQDYLHQFKK